MGNHRNKEHLFLKKLYKMRTRELRQAPIGAWYLKAKQRGKFHEETEMKQKQ